VLNAGNWRFRSDRVVGLRRAGCLLGLLAALLALLASPRAARAQAGTPFGWVEVPAGHFVLLGPPESAEDLNLLASRHGSEINQAYQQLSAIYAQSLPLPINIRLYQDELQLSRLNAIVPPLGLDGFHTRIGTREIALVEPVPPGFYGAPVAANIIRHELNGLFLNQLSAGLIPPGLEAGMNQYAEVPGSRAELSVERLRVLLEAGQASRLLSWRELLESQQVYVDGAVAYPQALSIVAFLVDSYGFDSLIQVVRAIGQGHSYRSALASTYGRPIEQLERDWLAYLPHYVHTRWQHNAIHSYNLQPFEAGLEAGAYSQVAAALEEVIPFLERTGQAEALAEARQMLATAQRGLSAAELAAAEQEAIARGDFEQAIQLAEMAQAAYAELGDSLRVHQLADHLTHLRKVVALRQQLAEARTLAEAGQAAAAEEQFLALAAEFQQLGDTEGRRMALAAIEDLYGQRIQAAGRRQSLARLLWLGAGGLAALIFVHQAILLGLNRRREPTIL
jgi:hypothetical protein